MIYTGADLIRTSGQQAARTEKLSVVKSPAPVDPASSEMNDDTKDALQRFARFLNEKHPRGRPKLLPSAQGNPYNRHKARSAMELDRGQMLDVYA